MITLISRQEVFAKYPNITSIIGTLQRDFFDDDEDYFENAQDLAAYRQMFDACHLHISQPESWYSILALNHTDIDTYVGALAQNLKLLFAEINVHGLVMIAHYKMNLVGNADPNYAPLQTAVKQLNDITGSMQYQEAIAFNVDDLSSLLNVAFWLGRCDPRAPEFIYFHDRDEKLAFYLCKYGALHVTELGNSILSADLLNRYGLHLVQGSCSDQFSESGKIAERKSAQVQ